MDVIYKITSPSNKIYIGRTDNFDRRMNEHKYGALTKKSDTSLYRAIRKYGWDSMDKKIICKVESDKSKKIEEELILAHNSVKNGYNDTYIGAGGDVWDGRRDSVEYMEFIDKMRKVNSSNRMHGKTHSKETRNKLKEKAKGRFSLPWYIERYGNEEGKQLYNERCNKLSNRKMNRGKGGKFVKST